MPNVAICTIGKTIALATKAMAIERFDLVRLRRTTMAVGARCAPLPVGAHSVRPGERCRKPEQRRGDRSENNASKWEGERREVDPPDVAARAGESQIAGQVEQRERAEEEGDAAGHQRYLSPPVLNTTTVSSRETAPSSNSRSSARNAAPPSGPTSIPSDN